MCSHINTFTAPSLIASALLAISWGASAAVPATTNTASSAQVEITANVLPTTCTASWAGHDTRVSLGSVAKSFMGDHTGDVGLTKSFELALTACDPGVNKVKVTASGTADTDVTDAFKNTETAGAQGVAVQLLTGSEVVSNGHVHEYSAANNEIHMPFTAQLINTKGSGVTAGPVKSTVTLAIDYE